MKQLWIHAGFGKAGSSHIQKFLMNNLRTLEEDGVKVLQFGLHNGHHHILHHVLAGKSLKSLPIQALAYESYDFDAAVSAIRDEIFQSQCNTFLVSAEGLGGFAEDQIRFRGLLEGLTGIQIKSILYMRHPIDYMYSIANQKIKNGQAHSQETSLSDIIVRGWDRKELYTNIIEALAGHIGDKNLILRPFEKESFVGGSLLQDFLHCLGIQNTHKYALPDGTTNQSVSPWAMDICKTINGFQETPHLRHLLNRMVDESVARSGPGAAFSRNDLLPEATVNAICDHYDGVFQDYAPRFLGKDRGTPFFKADYRARKPANAAYAPPSHDDMLSVMVRVWTEQFRETLSLAYRLAVSEGARPSVIIDRVYSMHRAAPDDLGVIFLLYNLLRENNRASESQKIFDQALAEHGDHPEFWYEKIRVHIEAGDVSEALQTYQGMPQNSENWDSISCQNNLDVTRRLVSALQKEAQIEDVLSVLSQALEIFHDQPDLLHSQGLAFMGLEQREAALTSFRKASEPEKPVLMTLVYGLRMALRLKRHEDVEHFERLADTFYPDHPKVAAELEKKASL